MNPDKYSKIYKSELAKLENKISKLFDKRSPKSLYDPCEYILQAGGKRVRPFLVLCSVKAVGGKFQHAYNAAVAVELVHNFTLVHDDIMDHAATRRGKPALHIKYDPNIAILSGDSLIALAYDLLLKDCKQRTNKIVETFTKGIEEVCEGQALDKEFETKKNVTIDDYKKMIYKKTSAMIVMSCKVGALLASKSQKEINAVSKYAKNIGMAFQIQDDLLDLIAEEAKFGKKIGGDLVEGKKTYLFVKAYEKAAGKDKAALNRFIRNKGINENEIHIFKAIYNRLGVINEARNEIKKYTASAIKQLKYMPDKEGRNLLEWLAVSLLKRIN